jgi:hypothetical protein
MPQSYAAWLPSDARAPVGASSPPRDFVWITQTNPRPTSPVIMSDFATFAPIRAKPLMINTDLVGRTGQ